MFVEAFLRRAGDPPRRPDSPPVVPGGGLRRFRDGQVRL